MPDKLDKSKDRGNALLDEMQELIENRFHGFPPPVIGAQRPKSDPQTARRPATGWAFYNAVLGLSVPMRATRRTIGRSRKALPSTHAWIIAGARYGSTPRARGDDHARAIFQFDHNGCRRRGGRQRLHCGVRHMDVGSGPDTLRAENPVGRARSAGHLDR